MSLVDISKESKINQGLKNKWGGDVKIARTQNGTWRIDVGKNVYIGVGLEWKKLKNGSISDVSKDTIADLNALVSIHTAGDAKNEVAA